MAAFRFNLFRGIRPRASSLKLPEGEAQTASNTKLGSGDLEPWLDDTLDFPLVNEFTNRTIHRFDNNGAPVWLEWDTFVDVARGTVKGDVLERTYYTGDGKPKMTFDGIAVGGGRQPDDFRFLGIPAPEIALTAIAPPMPEDLDSSDRRTVPQFLTTKLFEIVFVNWTIHPGTGTPTEEWRMNAAWNQDITFDLQEGDGLKVLEVVDDDTVRLGSAVGDGAVASSAANDKSNDSYWQPMDNQGSTQEAEFVGWRLPDGLTAIINGHRLRVGDVIRVTRLDYPFGLSAPFSISQPFWEQSWITEQDVTIDAVTFKQTSNAIVAASEDATSDFPSLQGGFFYDIDRVASEVAIIDDRTYVYTFVSSLGEEGPPSPPSEVIQALDGDVIVLCGLEVPPTVNYDITCIRIYRTNATEAGADFQFVKEIPVDVTAVDSVEAIDLGEVLSTATWDPPVETMQGITSLPNGMMVAFDGKDVHFAEPYFPHAWPPEYKQSVDYEIVGLAAFGNTVAILTEGIPSIITGSHPRNANIRPLKMNQSCLSKESIASLRDRIIYASPDGLIEIGVNGIRNITEAYVTKREWAAFDPATMVSEIHDGKYFGFFDGPDNVAQPPDAVAATGTIFSNNSETNVIAGTETLILTLTGTAEWEVTAGGLFDAIRQDIIDGLNSDGVELGGWNNEVRDMMPVTDVARTNNTQVTITFTAQAGYNITLSEDITITVPASALPLSAIPLEAPETLSIAALEDFSTVAIGVTDNVGPADVPYAIVAVHDITDWNELAGIGSTFKFEAEFRDCVYSPALDRWLSIGNYTADAGLLADLPFFSTSGDNGSTWTYRADAFFNLTDKKPRSAIWCEQFGFFAAVGDNKSVQISNDGIAWVLAPSNFIIPGDAQFGNLVLADEGGSVDYIYGTIDNTNRILRSPELNSFPPTYTWGGFPITYDTATGSKLLATGNANLISVGNDDTDCQLALIAHGAISGSSVGTISTYNAQGFVYGAALWVLVSNDFRIITCASGDEGTIGNWSAPGSSEAANVTIVGLEYDEGDLITPGFGYIAFGVNTSSNKGVIYTSSDAATWTLRHTTVEDITVRGMGVKYIESDRT